MFVKSSERTHYLVEVDVHALQLEVGGTIVAVADQYSELVGLVCREGVLTLRIHRDRAHQRQSAYVVVS